MLSWSSWAVPLWSHRFTFLLALISSAGSSSLYFPLMAFLNIFNPELIARLWREREIQARVDNSSCGAITVGSCHHCYLPQRSASDFVVNANKSKYYWKGAVIGSTAPVSVHQLTNNIRLTPRTQSKPQQTSVSSCQAALQFWIRRWSDIRTNRTCRSFYWP